MLLSSLGAQRGMPPAPTDAFKQGSSPVSRLYNWNLLVPVLKPFGIALSGDDKALVVAGDLDFISHVLSWFYERTVGELPMLVPKTTVGDNHRNGMWNVEIDNGAADREFDPSPISSRVAEMGVSRDDSYHKSSGLGDTNPGDPSSNFSPNKPLSSEKLAGETGPVAQPLRGADDARDAFTYLDDPNAPKTPLELLGRSLEIPFGLKRGEGEVLLARQFSTFQDWMTGVEDPPRAPRGRGHPALNWLDNVRLEIKTLAAMLCGKPGQPADQLSLGAAAAVFDVLGAGLAHSDRRVYYGTLQNLCALGRRMKDFPVLKQAHTWLAAAGGPSVNLVRVLTNAAAGYGPANIRVGDAKAAADAARAAAQDAAHGYAPNYEARGTEKAGTQFSLAFRADDTSDTKFAERAAEAAAVAELIERFCADSPKHLKAFLLEDLRNGADARSNPKLYIDALNVLTPALLARGPSPRAALAAGDTPGLLLLQALRCAEGPSDLREASITLLTTLWSAFPDEIEVKGEDCRQAISVLKRGARDVETSTQIHALACLFQLLHAFINAANAFSPVVYKTIVFMLIEHMRNDPVRDFITAELKVALDTHGNIPVGILVDPVVKQTSAGGQHPGLKRVDFELIASMSEHARLEARPALHLLALCLRTALDHTSGENPAGERAIALKAATRLAARLKGEEAAEEALERAAGGALARIAAEVDDPADPFFGESQRCAAEVLLATAHSMTAVGGAGVGHLRAIVREAATQYGARNGAGHPDMEAALHVLSLAQELGSYNPSPELIQSPGSRVLPPSPGNRGAQAPLASHQRDAPPRMAKLVDVPFASPPARNSGQRANRVRAHHENDMERFVSLESVFDRERVPADAERRGDRPPGRDGHRDELRPPPERAAARLSAHSDARSSYDSHGTHQTSNSQFVAGSEQSRRPANPTARAALAAQTAKREFEISQIAAKRGLRDRERDDAARDAADSLEAEKRRIQAKLLVKRDALLKKAAENGRGGGVTSASSTEPRSPRDPVREKVSPKVGKDEGRVLKARSARPAAPAIREELSMSPDADTEPLSDDAPLSPAKADEPSEMAAEDSEDALSPSSAKKESPTARAFVSPSSRNEASPTLSPRSHAKVRATGSFGPPPERGPQKVPSKSVHTSSQPVSALTAEQSYLKVKKSKEKLARAKEDRLRVVEAQQAAKAQAQHAVNLKKNLEVKKAVKESQDSERKVVLTQAREKSTAAKLKKAESEKTRHEENKRKVEAFAAKRAAERAALAKQEDEKQAELKRVNKQTAAEAARLAKAASLARPKRQKERKAVGLMGVKPGMESFKKRPAPGEAASNAKQDQAPAGANEQIDE